LWFTYGLNGGPSHVRQKRQISGRWISSHNRLVLSVLCGIFALRDRFLPPLSKSRGGVEKRHFWVATVAAIARWHAGQNPPRKPGFAESQADFGTIRFYE
jgi:hypothetical protein